jgi:Holliday junction resolvasome RuvABC DNA-binding subunit
MLDALLVNRIAARTGGIQAWAGGLGLAVACAGRDAQFLLSQACPFELPVELEIVLDGTNSAQMTLLGFASEARRSLYRAVKAVTGIGRESALAVLDSGELPDILRAVASDDQAFFRSVPGLGRKRVEALVEALSARFSSLMPDPIKAPVAALVEARDALVAGGEPDLSAEARLLAALKQAAKPPRTGEQWLALLER